MMMGAEIDQEEIDFLMNIVGSTSHVSMETASPAKRLIVEKAGREDLYGASWVYEAAQVIDRLDSLLLSGSDDRLPPVDDFPEKAILAALDRAKDKSDVLYNEVLPWLYKAYRYGYYQSIEDRTRGAS
jgi:hypothetical protein